MPRPKASRGGDTVRVFPFALPATRTMRLSCGLCASLLYSARISAELARRAARALIEEGWTSPQKKAGASGADRAQVLNRAGYARYDERTSTMLADTAELLLREYKGDLRL